MQILEGKIVFYNDAESWRTGVVKAAIDGAVLVQFDQMNDHDPSWSLPVEVVCLEEIMHAVEGGLKVWGFFDTRAELDAYLNWMQTLDKPKERVVKIIRNG
jgi:hypothetical protein